MALARWTSQSTQPRRPLSPTLRIIGPPVALAVALAFVLPPSLPSPSCPCRYVIWALTIAIKESKGRVLDLFNQWDDDKSGFIDVGEFHKALLGMGFDCRKDDAKKVGAHSVRRLDNDIHCDSRETLVDPLMAGLWRTRSRRLRTARLQGAQLGAPPHTAANIHRRGDKVERPAGVGLKEGLPRTQEGAVARSEEELSLALVESHRGAAWIKGEKSLANPYLDWSGGHH